MATRTAIDKRSKGESGHRRAGIASRLLALSLAKSGQKRIRESADQAIGYDAHGLPHRTSPPRT